MLSLQAGSTSPSTPALKGWNSGVLSRCFLPFNGGCTTKSSLSQ